MLLTGHPHDQPLTLVAQRHLDQIFASTRPCYSFCAWY